jgi:hypothetical protein
MKKEVMQTALIALAAYAVCYLIQDKGMKIPVIGDYLPGA